MCWRFLPQASTALTRRKISPLRGYEARVEITHGVEGRKRFKGILAGLEGRDVLMDVWRERHSRVRLPQGDIAEAKLLLTDR